MPLHRFYLELDTSLTFENGLCGYGLWNTLFWHNGIVVRIDYMHLTKLVQSAHQRISIPDTNLIKSNQNLNLEVSDLKKPLVRGMPFQQFP